ncbi:MAG: alpha/beta hydrolase [Spirochaetia bacterium]|jgi:pimeloyl-ACP methyl ester carboxylesterase
MGTKLTDSITTENGILRVSEATLFYRVRGTGPLLLILAGGHGDADTTNAFCEQLIDHYTVVTYDRRGLSRSTIDASAGSPSIATHSDDAHRLLTALTTEPALVFGSSIGALIGLDLVARHPRQIRVLVAHEPPAWDLLPEAERDGAVHALEDIVNAFRREGANVAFQKFLSLAAVDYADREPEVALARPNPQVASNMNFFFLHDVLGVNDYRVDVASIDALQLTPMRIVVAGGGRESVPHRCAEELSAKLCTTLVEFPGGHTGWLLRPKGFAAKLFEVLMVGDH